MIPENPGPLLVAISFGEIALLLIGIIAIYRLAFTPAGRGILGSASPLPAWRINIVDFGLACFAVIVGGVAGQILAGLYANQPEIDENLRLMIYGGGFQGGLLAGTLAASYTLRRQSASYCVSEDDATPLVKSLPPPPPPFNIQIWKAGGITFVALMPILLGLSLGWTFILESFGLSTDKQELVDLFASTDSVPILIGMTVLAAIVAPLVEEIIFRAGFFRFMRTRTPRWMAYVLPAAVFASLHGNLFAFMPLFVLGLIFAYAYERTGNIRVPIIAHSLFNLHTILLLLAGVEV
jgi:membrane protease YdiL (CAAX protease family)